MIFRVYPSRRYWRRQFERGQRSETGAYMQYVRMSSTAQVQNGKQNSPNGIGSYLLRENILIPIWY